ncbi:MAG: formylglycine-generating enzyme family protein [Gammaproteobacteria bacterium]|nr:formylglycine-generating enzyme family protein [Gammaproteobacteria bacterium]
MRWQLALAVLVVLLIIGASTTLINVNRAETEVLTVNLGIETAKSPAAGRLDAAAISAYERNQFSNELRHRLQKPRRSIELSGFVVDECEVTQLQWEQFVEWTSGQPGFESAEENAWLQSRSSGHRVAGRLTSPASGVNFKGASAYCSAAGGRLPFAEEFEAMASGWNQSLYPWGNEYRGDAWPFNSVLRNAAQSCGAHPSTSTPSGIHDLASNVMEWGQGAMYADDDAFQASIHGAPAARRSNRELYALNSAWLLTSPSLKSHYVGFRCVYAKHPLILPWRRRVQQVVNVPAGSYDVGLPEEARMPLFLANMPPLQGVKLRELIKDEGPTNELAVDRCEVSRAAFQKFLNDPLVRLGLFNNENQPQAVEFTPLYWSEQLEDNNLPVYGINWWAADAYARWAGGRLPSVEEWRQLAAGVQGYTYPWGMTYEEKSARNGDDAQAKLGKCGQTTADHTVAGVNDLAGNLSEWTRSLSSQNSNLAMWVQGGNWLLPGVDTAKSMFGRAVPLMHRSKSIGFRVVYD